MANGTAPRRHRFNSRAGRIEPSAPFRLAVEAWDRASASVRAMFELERRRPRCCGCARRKEPGIRAGTWPVLCARCVRRLPAPLRALWQRATDLPFARAMADAAEFLGAQSRLGVATAAAPSRDAASAERKAS